MAMVGVSLYDSVYHEGKRLIKNRHNTFFGILQDGLKHCELRSTCLTQKESAESP